MSTQYPDIFAALAAPFTGQGEVKERVLTSQGNRKLQYVTARTIMNRLDNVLGPEGWWDEFLPGENSVLCRLTIRLPDGSTLTKCDAGGYAGMADSGDDDKSGFSDAFKRAAVKFGVSRYLYRDGVPEYAGGSQTSQQARHATQPPRTSQQPANREPAPTDAPSDDSGFWKFVCDEVARCNDKADPTGRSAPLAAPVPLIARVAERALTEQHIDRFPQDPKERLARMALLYATKKDWVVDEVRSQLDRLLGDYRMGGNDADPSANQQPQQQQQGNRQFNSPPRTGRAMFAWVKDQEHKTGVGVLKYLNDWAKLQEFPGRMVDWDADQVALAHAEAERKLQSIGVGNNAEFSDAA